MVLERLGARELRVTYGAHAAAVLSDVAQRLTDCPAVNILYIHSTDILIRKKNATRMKFNP